MKKYASHFIFKDYVVIVLTIDRSCDASKVLHGGLKNQIGPPCKYCVHKIFKVELSCGACAVCIAAWHLKKKGEIHFLDSNVPSVCVCCVNCILVFGIYCIEHAKGYVQDALDQIFTNISFYQSCSGQVLCSFWLR